MTNAKLWIGCLLPALLLAMASCEDQHTDVLIQPPILLRAIAPPDSAVVTDDGNWPLRIELRSPIEAEELNLSIYPEPDFISAGRLQPTGKR